MSKTMLQYRIIILIHFYFLGGFFDVLGGRKVRMNLMNVYKNYSNTLPLKKK